MVATADHSTQTRCRCSVAGRGRTVPMDGFSVCKLCVCDRNYSPSSSVVSCALIDSTLGPTFCYSRTFFFFFFFFFAGREALLFVDTLLGETRPVSLHCMLPCVACGP